MAEVGTRPAPAAAHARPDRGALLRSAGFALLFLVAVLAGRLSILDGSGLTLVWPAAGVAVVWFAVQRRARTFWPDLLLLAAVTVGVNVGTGASLPLALLFVVANVAQLLVFHLLFARWCPELWGAGGRAPMTGVRQLGRLIVAAGLGSGAGAAIGTTALWALTEGWTLIGAAVWLTRNAVSIVLITAIGLRIGCLLADRRDRPAVVAAGQPFVPRTPFHAPRGRAAAELLLALGTSVAVYGSVFFVLDLPIGFTAIAVTVWVALRFDTTVSTVHDIVAGVVAVLATLAGHGPFAFDDLAVRALVIQLYTGLIGIIGLALALSRDERELLLRRVRAEVSEAQARAARMQVLAGMSRSLAGASDARAAICAAAREITGADGTYLMEPDGTGHLISTAMDGIDLPPLSLDAGAKNSMTARVLATGEAAFVADAGAVQDVSSVLRDALGVRSAVWQPVLAEDGKAIAVVGVIWRTPIAELPPDVPPMLETLAGEAAGAILRANLVNRLSQFADRDELTGVANRNRWDATVSREITRAQRSGQSLAFALVDLDGLRRYNEEHGRPAGDDLLRRFAVAIGGCLREDVDTVARAEGGGFSVAMPGCTAEDALTVAGRIRAAVPDGRTCTIGIAQWTPGLSGSQVLGSADRALYRGKQAGGDTAIVHRSEVQLEPAR